MFICHIKTDAKNYDPPEVTEKQHNKKNTNKAKISPNEVFAYSIKT